MWFLKVFFIFSLFFFYLNWVNNYYQVWILLLNKNSTLSHFFKSYVSRLEAAKKGVEEQLSLIKLKLEETEANAVENERQLTQKMEQKVKHFDASWFILNLNFY